MRAADSAAAVAVLAPPVAAMTTERARAAGTAALAPAACAARTTPTDPAVMPRRVNRSRSRSRPLTRRCRSVGSVQRRSRGGLLVGQTFQVAEDHRQPLTIGQAVELLVDNRGHVGLKPRPGRFRDGHGRCLRFMPAPPTGGDVRLHGGAIGDAVQPAAQRVGGADRAGLPRQDEEGRLEGVLDVVLVLEDGAAGGQDHRAVTGHQRLEGGLVVRLGISGQELAITQPDGGAVVEQVAEVPHGPSQRAARH